MTAPRCEPATETPVRSRMPAAVLALAAHDTAVLGVTRIAHLERILAPHGTYANGLQGEVVTEHGDPPVADAEDLHQRYRLTPSSWMVKDRIELGDEHVCVRRLVQDQSGLPGVHRAPGRQFLVKCADPGTDRAAAGQAARQPVAIWDQRSLVHPVFGEHRRDGTGIPADRAGVEVTLEDLFVRKGHFLQFTDIPRQPPRPRGPG